MAASQPMPPFLPESEEQFIEHVTANPQVWYHYCQAAYLYMEKHGNTQEESAEQSTRLQLRITDLEEQLYTANQDNGKLRAIIDYQKTQHNEQLQDATRKLIEAEVAKEKALVIAQPAVYTPPSAAQPEPVIKTSSDPTPGKTTSFATAPSESTRQSEKVPDPEKFNGQRSDLRRFVSQIHEKMIVNQDRFPTPLSRMSYVNSRLSGTPYSQILPYIRDGVCRLDDYSEILKILERAYGDPNRVQNTRSELFRFKQTNKEFAAFFAEFQRLGLEAEMNDESLATLLEQAISNELRGMLLHNPPTSRKYLDLAAHLQELENRRRYYQQPTIPTKVHTSITEVRRPQSPRPIPTFATVVQKTVQGEPMDLSNTRRPTDKEAGTCYRCHKAGHRVRDCPQPDNRPLEVQRRDSNARRYRMQAIGLRSPSPPRSPINRYATLQDYGSPRTQQPTPIRPPTPAYVPTFEDRSENGIRLD
jgi:hypothetical protein